MKSSTASVAGPRPVHPLHGAGRKSVPVAVVILIGWLAHLGWSAQQIVPVLAVLVPATAVNAARHP